MKILFEPNWRLLLLTLLFPESGLIFSLIGILAFQPSFTLTFLVQFGLTAIIYTVPTIFISFCVWSSYRIDVPEDLPSGTNLIRLLAIDRDADRTDPITYSLWPMGILDTELSSTLREVARGFHAVPGSGPDIIALRQLFSVNSMGWVILKSSLDFESQAEHTFKVSGDLKILEWAGVLNVSFGCSTYIDSKHWWERKSRLAATGRCDTMLLTQHFYAIEICPFNHATCKSLVGIARWRQTNSSTGHSAYFSFNLVIPSNRQCRVLV